MTTFHLALAILALLATLQQPAQEVNIDEHPALREQFDTCVPVVEIDGKIRFRGRVDRRLLERLITASGER